MNVSGVKRSAVCGIGAFLSPCVSSLLTPKQKLCCLSAVGNASGQDQSLPISPPRGLAHPLLAPGADPRVVPAALPDLPRLLPGAAVVT